MLGIGIALGRAARRGGGHDPLAGRSFEQGAGI
jgi:hypothetical protein